jgi:hypothetical protein
MISPVLIHIPHASVTISKQNRGDFVIPDEELDYEMIRLTDWYTDELFGEEWSPVKHHSVSTITISGRC